MEYKLANIRQLLETALTKTQFERILADDFPSVEDETSGQPIPDTRLKLVDYAHRQRQIPKLLNAIKEKNPVVYEEFKDALVEKEPISPTLQELAQILTSIDFNTTVVNAYRLSLPDIRPRQTPQNVEALLRLIVDIPEQPDELKPLWRFVSFLIQDKSLDSNCQIALKAWAKVQGIPLKSTSEPDRDKSDNGETYLMIKVKFHPPNRYIVSAAIAKDPDPHNPDVKVHTTSIAISTPRDLESGYSLEKLQLVLCELIATCGSKYRIPLSDLVVQWFLPNKVMSQPVEYWQIPTGNQKPCNLELCKAIVVRCSDRYFSSDFEPYLGECEKNWKRLIGYINLPSHQVLVDLDPMNEKTKVDWSKPNVAGCKFIEHKDPQQQENFWENLLIQGLPIALWSRHLVTQPVTKQKARSVMNSVTIYPLANLPNSLTAQRQKSLPKTSSKTSQPAAQLALLWDNPFRPFPDIEYKSN